MPRSRRQYAEEAATPLGAQRDILKQRFNPKKHVIHKGEAVPKHSALLAREDRQRQQELESRQRGGLSEREFKKVGGKLGFDSQTNKLLPKWQEILEKDRLDRQKASIRDRLKLQPGVIANIKARGAHRPSLLELRSAVNQLRTDPTNARFFTEVPLSTQGRSTGVSSVGAAGVAANQARQLGRQPTQQEVLQGRGFRFNDPVPALEAAIEARDAARRDLEQAKLDEPAMQLLGGTLATEPTAGQRARAEAIKNRLGLPPTTPSALRRPLDEQQQNMLDRIGEAQAAGTSTVEMQEQQERDRLAAETDDGTITLEQAKTRKIGVEIKKINSDITLNYQKAAALGLEAGFDAAKSQFESYNRLLASGNLVADSGEFRTMTFKRDLAGWLMEHFQRRSGNPGRFKAMLANAKREIASGADLDAARRLVASEFPDLFDEQRPIYNDKGKELPVNQHRRRLAESAFESIVNRVLVDSFDSGAS